MRSFRNPLSTFLPVLRTCKAVYSEASPLLYSTNTFYSSDADTIRYLTLDTPPSSVNHQNLRQNLRILTLDWCLFDSLKSTFVSAVNNATWTSIASLPSLTDLFIYCHFRDDKLAKAVDAESEQRFLKLVRRVTTPKNFVLVLTWQPAIKDDTFMSSLPCELVRKPGVRNVGSRKAIDMLTRLSCRDGGCSRGLMYREVD